MGQYDVYLQGKLKWPKLVQADSKFGEPKWSVVLYPDADSHNKILELQKKGIKNVIKKDEEGWFVTFSRHVSKTYRGKIKTFSPPILVDGKKPLPSGGYEPFTDAIGNGTDATVKIEVYAYKAPTDPIGKMTGCACRLVSVRVDNLVPYAPNKDYDEDQKKMVKGMDEQPEQPLF